MSLLLPVYRRAIPEVFFISRMGVSGVKWFKHDTDASFDAKVKKLIFRHGAVGYAVYFHCLELIAGNISETDITFSLEHDYETIADNLKIPGDENKNSADTVAEIIATLVELGLFEVKNDRICCLKLLSRLDTSMTSNSLLRKTISSAKESHDSVMTESCKNRIDKNRIDKINIYLSEFDTLWDLWPRKVAKKAAEKAFISVRKKGIEFDTLSRCADRYLTVCKRDMRPEKFILHLATFLNSRYIEYMQEPCVYEPKLCVPDDGMAEIVARHNESIEEVI